MSNNEAGIVTTSVTLHLRVARFLADKGYTDVEASQRYLLIGTTLAAPKQFLWLKWTARKRVQIATIYLEDQHRKASPNKHWVTDVFGDSFMDKLKATANELAAEFKVSVHLCLKGEEPVEVAEYDDFL